ncbi:MAG: MBG domain-containing protein [Verrucomicrobiota bacterium]
MKTHLTPSSEEPHAQPRAFCLYPLMLALWALAFTGLMATARADIYTNANNGLALTNLTAWLVSGGTPTVLPGTNDTIWVTGAAVTAPLGDDLSVYGLTEDNTITSTCRIGSTAGATLTLGAGGITKLVTGQKLEISCNVALRADQTWTNAGNIIQVDSSSAWTFNGYTTTITGPGTFDCRTSIECGTNVNIQCSTADMNYAAGDLDLGSGINSFKTFTLAAGTLEGNSFPGDTNAATTSAFGAGSCALALNNGILIYNGNTVATPEKITIGATGTNTINVSKAGQTLTLSNLYYGSGSSQPTSIYLNFGGAGNLTLIRGVSNAPSSPYAYGVNKSGAGTLTLCGTNTYSWITMISGGKLVLTGGSTLSNTPLISMAGGTTFDVSGLSSGSFTLGSGRTLANNTVTTSALKGNINASQGTIAVSVNGSAPAFTISSGTFTVSTNTVFQINSGIGTPGTYPLIAKGVGGSVTGAVLPTVNLYRATGHLEINAGELDLVVDTADLLNYYVSPTGSDATGNGTQGNPYQTITQARDAIRFLGAQSEDINVYLRGGRYQITNTISFTTADSGMNGFFINYRSYPGESVTISGGKQVTGWTKVPGKPYWVTSVPTNAGFADYFRQLYVNGVRAERARSDWIPGAKYVWTNGSSFNYSTATSGLTNVYGIAFAQNSGMKNYSNVNDLRLLHIFSFRSDEFPVLSIITNSGMIDFELQQCYCQTRYGMGYFNYNDGWMVINAIEELDEPGEWCLNTTTHQVYYYPNSFENMNTAVVYAPVVEALVTITGDSMANPVQNLRFQGLTFEHGNWFYPRDCYLGGAEAEELIHEVRPGVAYYSTEVPGTIRLKNTDGIQFVGNTIQHQANCGIHLYAGASDTLIQGNFFNDLTAAAVYQYNIMAATYKSGSICSNTLVADNVIRNTGMDFLSSTLVNMLGGYRFQLVRNDMADCGYSGYHGANQLSCPDPSQGVTLLASNRITMAMGGARYGIDDGGYIYTAYAQSNSLYVGNDLYDINPTGNVWVSAFYQDNESYGIHWSNNVVRQVVPGRRACNWQRRSSCAWPDDLMYNTYTDATEYYSAALQVFYNYVQITNGVWPPAALNIIQGAGVGPAYDYLLTNTYSGVNLAKNQFAWASSSNDISQAGADWDYSSAWHSASNDTNSWWAVDLGAPCVIQRLELAPRTDLDEPDARCNFQVQAANDTNFTSYTVLAEQSSVPFAYQGSFRSGPVRNSWIKFINNPGNYRYLRVRKTSGSTLSFSEFQAYGHAALVPATVTLGNLNQAYDGTGKAASATTTPAGLTVNLTYNGSSALPVNVGSYTVVGAISDPTYVGSATATMTIFPAAPAGLGATPGDTVVTLSWSSAPGAASYNVKRSLKSGGPYTTITNVTALVFTDTGLSNGTNYYYVVSGVAAGLEGANSAQVSAKPALVAPGIATQPTSCTNVAGAVATFMVTATGVPLNYTWRKNGAPLTDGGNISGSATAILSLNNVSAADQGSYSVVITNRLGSVTSSNATLAVITGLPVASGLMARYDAQTITGFADGATVTNWPDSSGNGNTATNAGGTPIYVAQGYNGLPVVRFTADGNSTFTMKTRRTDIRTVFWVCKEPVAGLHFLLGDSGSYDFHRGPSGNTIWDGTYASANIRNGSTRLNGAIVNGTTTPLGTNWNIVDVVTTGNVTAGRISYDRGNGGRSWAGDIAEIMIYNTALSSNDVIMTESYLNQKWTNPQVPVAIAAQPSSLTNNPGTLATLTVSVTGTSPSYQWRKNGTNVSNGGKVSGAMAATLSLSNVSAGDAGSYDVVVANPAGSVTSSAATLAVQPPTTPTNLTWSVSGNALTLSWPSDYLGWLLQKNTGTDLRNSNAWVDLPGTTNVYSTNAPIVATNRAVFYRLRHP